MPKLDKLAVMIMGPDSFCPSLIFSTLNVKAASNNIMTHKAKLLSGDMKVI